MLEVRDLDVYYGNIRAVAGVSLTVGDGETVCLIGSNGAGKSTILRTISGLLRPRRGEILYNGHALTTLSPFQIVGLGVAHCPEGRHIFGSLTVHENLVMGAVQRKAGPEVTADLDKVYGLFPRLAERRSQTAATLSGGEQQMLAIGRALMRRPSLLLLDEPSLGLAPIIVDTIFQVIAEMKKSGLTILLVEQNAHRALEVADRGYVLETGRIVAQGTAAEFLADADLARAYLGEVSHALDR